MYYVYKILNNVGYACVCVCGKYWGKIVLFLIWIRFIYQFPFALYPSTSMYGSILGSQNISVVALLLCNVNKSVCHSLIIGSRNYSYPSNPVIISLVYLITIHFGMMWNSKEWKDLHHVSPYRFHMVFHDCVTCFIISQLMKCNYITQWSLTYQIGWHWVHMNGQY